MTQHRRAQAIGELSSLVARAIRVSATEIIQVRTDNDRQERVRSITARLSREQVQAARSLTPAPTPPAPEGLDAARARSLVDEIHALADSIGHLDRLAALEGPALTQGVQAHRQIFQALMRRLGSERSQRLGFDDLRINRLLDQVAQA